MPWTEKYINTVKNSTEWLKRKKEGFDLGNITLVFATGWIIGILTAIWLFNKV